MLQRSTKIIAGMGALFFLGSLCIGGGFLYRVVTLKADFVKQEEDRARAEAHSIALKDLMRTLEETKDERESLFSRVLDDEEVIDFLALIESIGREQKLTLTTSSLTVQPIDDTFEHLVIGISTEGGYASVMQTLKMMESLPYQVDVSGVQFARGEGERRNMWQSSYTVKVTKFKKP